MGTKVEYTTPEAPQQNRKVEQKFALLHNRVHACVEWGEIFSFFEKCIVVSGSNSSTLLENNLITTKRHQSPLQKCFGKGK